MAFVTFENLEEVIDATLEQWLPEFNFNPFKQVVLMKFISAKLVAYGESLAESNPEQEHLAYMAVSAESLFSHLDSAYSTPKEDDRWQEAANAFEEIINKFISEMSDDASVDLIFIGAVLNCVAHQHTGNWSAYCEKHTDGFVALQAAKKTNQFVDLLTHHIAKA